MAMATQHEIEAEAARPMRFFPHDADAATDIKCRRLIRRLGFEGYGRWWRLCEMRAATDGHKLCVETEEDAEIIAEELRLGGHSDLIGFLSVLADVGLVHLPGDGTVYSDRMLSNAEYFGKKRTAARKGGRSKRAQGGGDQWE